jgi:2-haloacid dehalogenase
MKIAVLFDALGTLFDLGRREQSAEFARTLHHAASLTLAGEFAPLAEIARGVDPELPQALVEAKAHEDAAEALELLAAAAIPVYVLTNGSTELTRELLHRTGLSAQIADVFSVDDVRRFKPDPAPYALAARGIGLPPEQIVLVAAHAWDVLGARNAGLDSIWVNRQNDEWPLPVEAPKQRAADLVEAAGIATRRL